MTETRTKRRYAHELYPHPEEGEIRPLSVDVPYLLARAIGYDIDDTSWTEVEPPVRASDRVVMFSQAAQIAFLADALLQGMSGQQAWQWAEARVDSDTTDEFLWERAEHYGVPVGRIKPYPCGPEPSHHHHVSNGTWGIITTIPLPEAQCPDCTESAESRQSCSWCGATEDLSVGSDGRTLACPDCRTATDRDGERP